MNLWASINKKVNSPLPLKEIVSNLELSVQVMSDKYDEVLARLTKQASDLKDLKNRVGLIENNDQTKNIYRLEKEVIELEWRSRRSYLEVHDIKPTEHENLLTKTNEVARVLDVEPLTGRCGVSA